MSYYIPPRPFVMERVKYVNTHCVACLYTNTSDQPELPKQHEIKMEYDEYGRSEHELECSNSTAQVYWDNIAVFKPNFHIILDQKEVRDQQGFLLGYFGWERKTEHNFLDVISEGVHVCLGLTEIVTLLLLHVLIHT